MNSPCDECSHKGHCQSEHQPNLILINCGPLAFYLGRVHEQELAESNREAIQEKPKLSKACSLLEIRGHEGHYYCTKGHDFDNMCVVERPECPDYAPFDSPCRAAIHKREQEIVEWIGDYWNLHGLGPSFLKNLEDWLNSGKE